MNEEIIQIEQALTEVEEKKIAKLNDKEILREELESQNDEILIQEEYISQLESEVLAETDLDTRKEIQD